MNNELNNQEELMEKVVLPETMEISEEKRRLQQMREELVKSTKEAEGNIPTFEEQTEEKQQEKGKQFVKVPPKRNPNNYGFADKLLIILLVGFAGGVIATATYIFLNLGKFTFTI